MWVDYRQRHVCRKNFILNKIVFRNNVNNERMQCGGIGQNAQALGRVRGNRSARSPVRDDQYMGRTFSSAADSPGDVCVVLNVRFVYRGSASLGEVCLRLYVVCSF